MNVKRVFDQVTHRGLGLIHRRIRTDLLTIRRVKVVLATSQVDVDAPLAHVRESN